MALPFLGTLCMCGGREFQRRGGGILGIGRVNKMRKYLCLLKEEFESLRLVIHLGGGH